MPSALSEIIRQLEAELGAALFDRSHRPPVITPFGRDFLAETAPMVEGMDRALTRLRQNAGLQTGTLAIGAAVVTGLVPATGISLPFFSYGGTALLCQLAEMGIVLSVSRQMPAPQNG